MLERLPPLMISALCALERFLVPFVQELIKYICHMLRTNVDETSNGKKKLGKIVTFHEFEYKKLIILTITRLRIFL